MKANKQGEILIETPFQFFDQEDRHCNLDCELHSIPS